MEYDFKSIDGYDNYAISNLGEVLSYKRGYWKRLKPYLGKNGYCYVNLSNEAKVTHKYIHRLVAEAFLENPERKTVVNHIDGDKSNNNVENLEWVTFQENSKHAFDTGLVTFEGRHLGAAASSTPIIATDPITGERLYFKSQHEASRVLGMTVPHINKALRGSCLTAYGYTFEYAEESEHV